MFSVGTVENAGAIAASGGLEVGDRGMDELNGKEILSFEQILSYVITYHVIIQITKRNIDNLITVRNFCPLYRFSLGLYLIMFSLDMVGNAGASAASAELGVGDGSTDEPNGKEILSFEQILSYAITHHVIIYITKRNIDNFITVRKFCLFDRFSHGLYLIMFLVHMIGNTGAGEAAGELGVGDGSMDVSKGKEILSFEQILFFSRMISYRVLFHLKI
jgi:hypothetical protein